MYKLKIKIELNCIENNINIHRYIEIMSELESNTNDTGIANKFSCLDSEVNAINTNVKKIDFTDGDEYVHDLGKSDNIFYVIQGSGVTFYNNKEYYWKKNDIINLTETNKNIKHYAYNKETSLLYISSNESDRPAKAFENVLISTFGG